MLTLKELNNGSTPIAKYGKGKFIFFSASSETEAQDSDKFSTEEFENAAWFKKLSKRVQTEKLDQIRELFLKPISRPPRVALESGAQIFFDSGSDIQPVPSFDLRDIIYVSGPSGVGKSYFTAKYAEKYHAMYPGRDIFLFSKKGEDPVFDEKKYISRIVVSEDLFDSIDVKTFGESLVIFDDAHTFKDAIGKKLLDLQIDLMNLGRSYSVDIVITSHLLSDYRKTRDILNEMTALVVYPSGTGYHQLRYTLERHFGLDKKEIRKIKSLKSRWVYLRKFPRYVIHQKGAFLLD